MYYYQQLNEIGKQIALVRTREPITDAAHYREVDKNYYDEVLELLREEASREEVI